MSFWDVHGIWFIIAMFFFPRLTLLFSSSYWDTNRILVVLTWIWALGGESAEKGGGHRIVVR
jgi:hypothetical protein